jgi:UDP-N-acetyl-D-glucosamine dehydrogenase
MTVGIEGLGYVGLPLAVAFAEAGVTAIGVDVDAERVDALRAGRSQIEDVSDDVLAAQAERMRFETDFAAVGEADAVLVCVPTPLTDSEVDHDRVAREAALVLDLRGVTRGLDSPTVERL